jgi:hypothetical protein
MAPVIVIDENPEPERSEAQETDQEEISVAFHRDHSVQLVDPDSPFVQ